MKYIIEKIENNYDNLDILKIIESLLFTIQNDVEYMNDASDFNNEDLEYLDLGNNNEIKKEDYESLCSIIDTLYFIKDYNEKRNK